MDLQDNDLNSEAVSLIALFTSFCDLLAPATYAQRAVCPRSCHPAECTCCSCQLANKLCIPPWM